MEMKWALLILALIVGLLLFISLLKLKIKIDFLHSRDNDYIKIKFMTLFGLISYTYNVPVINVDKESPSLIVKSNQKMGDKNQKKVNENKQRITPNEVIQNIKKTKEFLEHVIHLHSIVKKFMKHITIHQFDWNSRVGLGEAANTGIGIGVLWSLKGGILGILSQYMKLQSTPRLNITPNFQENVIDTKLLCIISFRIGHAIGGALSVVKYWKSTKGGKQHVRTSNSRLNDNSYGKLEAND